LYSSVNITEVTESRTRSWVRHVAYMEETSTVRTPGGRKHPEDLEVDGVIIKMELKELI
jgi:hypothetical protein